MAGGGSLIIKGGTASKGEVEVINGALKVTGISGGGGGVDNPMTANLDAAGFNIFDVGVLEVRDGSVAAPSITNEGDEDTGIYFPAANELAVGVAGAQALRFNATGAGGAGEALFNVRVRISSGSAAIPGIFFDGDTDTGLSTDNSGNIKFSVGGAEVGQITATEFEAVQFRATGSSVPTYTIDSDPNSGFHLPGSDVAHIRTGGVERVIVTSNDVTSLKRIIVNETGIAANAVLANITSSTSVTGNVQGLLTTLTCTGDLTQTIQQSGAGNAAFVARVIGVGNPYTNYDINGGESFAVGIDQTSGTFRIQNGSRVNNGTNAVTIDANDRVSMGTTSPDASAKLTLTSTTEGALLPRMTNAQRDAIGTPADGLLLYTTDEESLEVSDQTDWLRVGPADYGNIYVSGGAGSQTITTGGTYEKVTQFATNGESRNMTNDQANDMITIDNVGTYLVSINMSFTGSNNATVDIRAHWNSVAQDQIHFQRKIGTGTDVGSGSAVGLLDVTTAGQDLEVFWTSDSNGDALGVAECSLTVTRLS
jgi:hypothetical protein